MQALGRLRRRGRRHRPAPVTRRALGRPAPHERYLWDSGWPLRRVARARRDDGGTIRPIRFVATTARSPPPTSTGRPASSPASPRSSATATPKPTATASSPRRARRLAHRVPRRRRPRHDPDTPRPTSCAPSPSGSSPTTCAPRRRPTSSSSIRGRHPPRHRLPRHAVPAPGARRPRPPRRRLRAALPGHRAVVARHDRPRRHHRLGGLGRRRRRHRHALAQPLQQGRRHLVPAPLRRRPPARRARLPATGCATRPST